MAHTCPECGMLCHCKGDIDDVDLGRWPVGGCVHYMKDSCDGNEDRDDEDSWDDLDYDDPDQMAEDNSPVDSRNL